MIIDYKGVKMSEEQNDGFASIVLFEIRLLNTITESKIKFKIRCSSAAIENPKFDAGKFIAEKSRMALDKYSKIKGVDITIANKLGILLEIAGDIGECRKAWMEGNKEHLINWNV